MLDQFCFGPRTSAALLRPSPRGGLARVAVARCYSAPRPSCKSTIPMWSTALAAPRRGTKPGGAGFSYVKPPPAGRAAHAATRGRFVMSDRERDPKARISPKEQPQPVVGRDVPDESKERHTEIAVEVGHQDDSKKGEKSVRCFGE